MEDDSEDFIPRNGGVFHGFQVGECLGVGSSGCVHRVRDVAGQVLALKYLRLDLHDDPVIVDRFLREKDILHAFRRAREQGETCPSSLPEHHSHGEFHDIPFIVMGCVEGQSLDKLWRREPLSILFVADALLSVCEALSFCHKRGIVHRDVKPGNIVVMTAPRGEVCAVLIDFGLASAPESVTSVQTAGTCTSLGTLGYMPPELARPNGEPASVRGDIFSLGATLCCCAYRVTIFPEGTEAEIFAHAENGNIVLPARRSDDPGIWEIIKKATRPNPEDRYASVEEFAHDLRQVRDICARTTEPSPPPVPRVRPRLLVTLMTLAFIGGWFLGHHWA